MERSDQDTMKGKQQSYKHPYIIAETAYNHEGDITYLYQMIDELGDLQVNAVKFHLLLNLDSYMERNHPLFSRLKTWLFSKQQWTDIITYTQGKRLDIVALCDDVESINFLQQQKNIRAIEIHATSINDYFMLQEAAAFPGRIILGVGGSNPDEITYAIDMLKAQNKQDILLMYGFQSYPTKYEDINLSKMIELNELLSLPVGYADHTGFNDPHNEVVSVAAAMMGFEVLEKHYTLTPGKKRVDYEAAVGKKQLKKIKELMEIALRAHGRTSVAMSTAEQQYGGIGPMKKAIVAKTPIKKGTKLSLDNLWFKRTEEKSKIPQRDFLKLIGRQAKVHIKKDEIIDYSKIG